MKKSIYLAGGCFWGVEEYFSNVKGVIDTTVGYCNGTTAFPTYEEVKSGKTGHAETVKIDYDPEVISLEKLLEHYLRIVDPYSIDQQGEDKGHQYRSGVYYDDMLDGIMSGSYIVEHLEKKPAIEVLKMCNFYKAEEYHQDYLKKNPCGYCHVDMSLLKDEEKKD